MRMEMARRRRRSSSPPPPGPMALLLLLLLALLAPLAARGTVYFREQFLDGVRWQERWVLSQHKANYGKFRLTAGNVYGDRETDKGLQTSENAKFYAISSRFKPFSNKGRPLVIQYTVKHEQKIDCGGGYVKIFPSDLEQKNMSGESLYYIMFGPDICGSDTKKVHVILNYKNQLYPIKKQIRCKVDGFTHLYTLVLRPDHTYKVKIDREIVAEGILEDDWDFLPPRKINNPAVKKPVDWDDAPEIDDPEDTKPEDWDVSEYIVDNSAEKPPDWDEAKRGSWQAPLLKNPLYRVRSGTIFDNFLITDDEEFAEEFGDETWGETKDPEQEMSQKQTEEDKKRKRGEARKAAPRGRARPRRQQQEGPVAPKDEL
ncbi:calreticulin-3 isoform X2 [Hemicordylus capensis]|uniref:calreticulin-3 isoform X2 n=1 Tax=Hemicordylus capensis TaxID=884348 RepID=UPI002303106F|nr:calreticulin-3 isoform X2 [Hemicordylus capensis]